MGRMQVHHKPFHKGFEYVSVSLAAIVDRSGALLNGQLDELLVVAELVALHLQTREVQAN